jgi:hypothetical protein
MVSFIDEHRGEYGVEPICRVLPTAPSTDYEHLACRRDPTRRSACALRDDELKPLIQRVWIENRCVYGAYKMWRELNRLGLDVARCTVERPMRDLGLRGAIRGKAPRTTSPDDAAVRPFELVKRSSQPKDRISSGSPT